MKQAMLSVVLIAGLLASGTPCEWLCQLISPPVAIEAQAHCHTDAQPVAPVQGEPCGEDCASCGISGTPIPASEFAAGSSHATDHALTLTRSQVGSLRQVWVSQNLLRLADPLPPTDILAMTTSLRL